MNQQPTHTHIRTQPDDEPPEVVDPYPKIRADCRKACPKPLASYDACTKRIAEKQHGDCEAWYIELVNCVDKCAAPKVFKLTKE